MTTNETINAAAKPQHVAAMCPACKLPLGIPQLRHGDERFNGESVRDLACVSCGHGWYEDDDEQVALAWYGQGAEEAGMG